MDYNRKMRPRINNYKTVMLLLTWTVLFNMSKCFPHDLGTVEFKHNGGNIRTSGTKRFIYTCVINDHDANYMGYLIYGGHQIRPATLVVGYTSGYSTQTDTVIDLAEKKLNVGDYTAVMDDIKKTSANAGYVIPEVPYSSINNGLVGIRQHWTRSLNIPESAVISAVKEMQIKSTYRTSANDTWSYTVTSETTIDLPTCTNCHCGVGSWIDPDTSTR